VAYMSSRGEAKTLNKLVVAAQDSYGVSLPAMLSGLTSKFTTYQHGGIVLYEEKEAEWRLRYA